MQKYIIILFHLVLVVSSYSFDRETEHQNRINSFDIANRQNIENSESSVQSISTGFSDLSVSLSIAPAKFSQDNSTIINLQDSTWLVVFDDDRNGSRKIYWQLYNAFGQPIGSNELIASSQIGSDYIEPIIKTDSSGRVYLFFRNSSEGLIYGSRYNANLTIDVPLFLVNDTSGASFAGPYDIAIYPNGKIAVVWENYAIVGSTVELRLYNELGITTFGPSTVNSDGGTVSHWVPSIDIDPSGNFVVAWEDYRNNNADIFARLFNGAGTAVGSDFAVVPPPFNVENQFTPQVQYIENNQFVIGWIDQRDGQECYYQVYSALTGLVGGNLLIATADNLFINWNLSLVKDNSNLLSAVWSSLGPQNFINMQSFSNMIIPVGSKMVKNSSTTGRRWQPSLCFNNQNEYLLSWSEFAVDNSDIFFNIFDTSHNSILANEIKANDDSVGAFSINPQMVVSTDWYNLIVFEDRRNDAGDIFMQTISNAGIRLYANIKVNQDSSATQQSEPAIAASIQFTKSLVTWVDNRNLNAQTGQRIFARFANEFGLFTENEFLVSDSSEAAIKKSPQVAINSLGNALIVWLDKRSGTDQIYGQLLDASGGLVGSDFRISDSLSDSTITDLQVNVDNFSNYYITYLDKMTVPRKLKSKQILDNGNIGLNFETVFSIGTLQIEEIATVVKPNGNIVVVFAIQDTSKRLYLAEYTSSGTEINAPFEILDMTNINGSNPDVAISNNGYLSVTWVDTRNGKKEIYSQIYDNLLGTVNNNNKVSLDSPEFMESPVTTAYNGRVWFSWADPRTDGMNIYANNSIYLATDIDDNDIQIPNGFELSQNFPNPFNPSTEISFRLPEKSFVTISVFNMLGQQVKRLVESELSAGVHIVNWDATNQNNTKVSSGIYFYKMETESFVEMKKMVLLK